MRSIDLTASGRSWDAVWGTPHFTGALVLALALIGGCGRVSGVPSCARGIPSANEEEARRAIGACAELGPAAAGAIPALVERAGRADALSVVAFIALSRLGPAAVEPVKELRGHASPAVRSQAVATLVRLVEQRAMTRDSALIAALESTNDADEAVRSAVVSALAQLVGRASPDERARGEAALAAGLADPSARVRANAAAAYRLYSGSLPAAPQARLEQLLLDPDPQVRREAGQVFRTQATGSLPLPQEWGALPPQAATETLRQFGLQSATADSLAMAVKYADLLGVRLLLLAGVDPNEPVGLDGFKPLPPLHRAVLERDAHAARLLLAAGADPHKQDDLGRDALALAQTVQDPRIEALLHQR